MVVVSKLALVPAGKSTPLVPVTADKSAPLVPVTGWSSARTSSVTVSAAAAVLPVLPMLLATTAVDLPATMLLLLLALSLFGLELLEDEEEDGRVSPLLAEFWR